MGVFRRYFNDMKDLALDELTDVYISDLCTWAAIFDWTYKKLHIFW